MIRICKNKTSKKAGFTLLEMVLVIAIMTIMYGYLYATFKTVAHSHLKVTLVNDMHDYASLSLKAIENKLCNATTIGVGDDIKVEDSSYVSINDANALPGFTQYHTATGLPRWSLALKITTDSASKTVTVVLEMTDNGQPSAGVAYSDSITVYLPAAKPENIDNLNGAGACSFSTAPVT